MRRLCAEKITNGDGEEEWLIYWEDRRSEPVAVLDAPGMWCFRREIDKQQTKDEEDYE